MQRLDGAFETAKINLRAQKTAGQPLVLNFNNPGTGNNADNPVGSKTPGELAFASLSSVDPVTRITSNFAGVLLSGTGSEDRAKEQALGLSVVGNLDKLFALTESANNDKVLKFLEELDNEEGGSLLPKTINLAAHSRGCSASLALANQIYERFGNKISINMCFTDPVPGPNTLNTQSTRIVAPIVDNIAIVFSETGKKDFTDRFITADSLNELIFPNPNTVISAYGIPGVDHATVPFHPAAQYAALAVLGGANGKNVAGDYAEFRQAAQLKRESELAITIKNLKVINGLLEKIANNDVKVGTEITDVYDVVSRLEFSALGKYSKDEPKTQLELDNIVVPFLDAVLEKYKLNPADAQKLRDIRYANADEAELVERISTLISTSRKVDLTQTQNVEIHELAAGIMKSRENKYFVTNVSELKTVLERQKEYQSMLLDRYESIDRSDKMMEQNTEKREVRGLGHRKHAVFDYVNALPKDLDPNLRNNLIALRQGLDKGYAKKPELVAAAPLTPEQLNQAYKQAYKHQRKNTNPEIVKLKVNRILDAYIVRQQKQFVRSGGKNLKDVTAKIEAAQAIINVVRGKSTLPDMNLIKAMQKSPTLAKIVQRYKHVLPEAAQNQLLNSSAAKVNLSTKIADNLMGVKAKATNSSTKIMDNLMGVKTKAEDKLNLIKQSLSNKEFLHANANQLKLAQEAIEKNDFSKAEQIIDKVKAKLEAAGNKLPDSPNANKDRINLLKCQCEVLGGDIAMARFKNNSGAIDQLVAARDKYRDAAGLANNIKSISSSDETSLGKIINSLPDKLKEVDQQIDKIENPVVEDRKPPIPSPAGMGKSSR